MRLARPPANHVGVGVASFYDDDTVRTFATEGTPLNYLSNATSMSDLSATQGALGMIRGQGALGQGVIGHRGVGQRAVEQSSSQGSAGISSRDGFSRDSWMQDATGRTASGQIVSGQNIGFRNLRDSAAERSISHGMDDHRNRNAESGKEQNVLLSDGQIVDAKSSIKATSSALMEPLFRSKFPYSVGVQENGDEGESGMCGKAPTRGGQDQELRDRGDPGGLLPRVSSPSALTVDRTEDDGSSFSKVVAFHVDEQFESKFMFLVQLSINQSINMYLISHEVDNKS